MTRAKYVAATVTLVFALGSWAGIAIINNKVGLGKIFTRQITLKENVTELKGDFKDMRKEVKQDFKEFRKLLEEIDDKMDHL